MKIKNLIFTTTIAVSAVALGESLFVPLTSDEHLNQYTLKMGEIAYKTDTTDGGCSLMIGNDTRQPYYVSDDRALKCQNIYQELDETTLSIIKSDNITYDDGTYLCHDTTDTIDPNHPVFTLKVIAPEGYILGNINYDTTELDLGGRFGVTSDITTSFLDNTATITIKCPGLMKVKIWNITAKVKNSDVDIVNDTTLIGKDFIIKDSGFTKELPGGAKSITKESNYKLSGLRSWVANLYNGNRGQHWANYDATNTVFMAGHDLRWTAKGNTLTGFNYRGEKLSWYNSSQRMVYSCDSEQDPSVINYDDAAITITEINCGDKTQPYDIIFNYYDIPSVDITLFKVRTCTDLTTQNWIDVDPDAYEILSQNGNDGTIKFSCDKSTEAGVNKEFYKIVYNPTIRQKMVDGVLRWVEFTPQMVFDQADLVVLKGIILKSPNGTYYRLQVANDGSLSTAEYGKRVNTNY